MNNFTFSFEGTITIKAETEEEARELADELVAPTSYAYNNCEDISIYDIELTEVEDENDD